VREFLHSNLSTKEFESLNIASTQKDSYEIEDEEEHEDEDEEEHEEEVDEVKLEYPSTTILIIRDSKNQLLDDRIAIIKTDDDTYTFRYTDRVAKTSSGKTYMTCNKKGICSREVIASLRYTLNFLVIDNDPFQSIQVMIPGLPSILLNTREVTATNRDTIYDAMEMTMRNWPTKV
jgi:hypothetical protein